MDITTESIIAKGRAVGLAEAQAERDELGRWSFLQAALLRFNSIPEYREAQVRDASWDQIKVWFIRLHGAPDLESVFDGGDNGDADD